MEDNYVKDMIERLVAKCRQSVTGRSRSIFDIFKDRCVNNLERKSFRLIYFSIPQKKTYANSTNILFSEISMLSEF